MKTFFSFPSNKDFFDRYAPLIKKILLLGFICQLVSGGTEFGIIYTMGKDAVVEIFPRLSVIFGITLAVIGTLFIEVGQRLFVPYAVRSILHNLFSGLDGVMSFCIISVALLLLYFGGSFSFQNSYNIVDYVTPEAEETDIAPIKQEQQEKELLVLKNFSNDSSIIVDGIQSQINAKNLEYQSLIGVKESEIRRYRNKGKREEKSYGSKISTLRTDITEYEAKRDAGVALLTAQQATEVKGLLDEKKEDLEELEKKYTALLSGVKIDDKAKKDDVASQVQKGGSGLGWFTLVCLFVVVVSIVLDETLKKGSEMKQEVKPSKYMFSTSVIGDFIDAIKNRMQSILRQMIDDFESETQEAPHPTFHDKVYDYSNVAQEPIKVHSREIEGGAKQIYIDGTPMPQGGQRNRTTGGGKPGAVQVGVERDCERPECNDTYIPNTRKHRYCGDSCRVADWEKKNGRKVKRRKSS